MPIKTRVNIPPELAHYGESDPPVNSIAKGTGGRVWAVYANFFDLLAWPRDINAAYSDDNGLTWTVETVAAGVFLWTQITLVISSDDVPHVIYGDYPGGVGPNGRVRYVSRAGGLWGAPGTVYTEVGNPLDQVSSCIDSADVIHIATSVLHTNCRYHFGNSGAWNSELVSAFAWDNRPSIGVDSADVPFIVYERDAFGLAYVNRVGGIWNAPELAGNTGWDISIRGVIDDLNTVTVAWRSLATGDLMFNKRVGGAWAGQAVAVPNTVGHFEDPILILDSSRNAYILYQLQGAANIVWYRQITPGGAVGAERILDAALTKPAGWSCLHAGLWHRHPSAGVLAQALCPTALLFDNNAPAADIYFEAPGSVPTVTTLPESGVSFWQAIFNGQIADDGSLPCRVRFQYGTSPALGTYTQWQIGPFVSNDIFQQLCGGLNAGTRYHFRAEAENDIGTGVGSTLSFWTWGGGGDGGGGGGGGGGMTGASVAMVSVTEITERQALLTGLVEKDAGQYGAVRFEYGATGDYGTVTPWQSGFHGGDTFIALITGLSPGSAYHCRAVFKDGSPPVYSGDMTFSTLSLIGDIVLVGDELVYLLEEVP